MTQTVAAVPAHDAGARRPGASHGPPKGSEDLFGPLLARATQPVREGKGPERSEHSARTARAEGAQEAPADAEGAVAVDELADGQPVPAAPSQPVDGAPVPAPEPEAQGTPEAPEAQIPTQQPGAAPSAPGEAELAPAAVPVADPTIPPPPAPSGEAPIALPAVEPGEAPLGPVAPPDPQAVSGQPVDPTLDGPVPIAPTPLPASTAAVVDPAPVEAAAPAAQPAAAEAPVAPTEEQVAPQTSQQPQGGSTDDGQRRDDPAPRPGLDHERRIDRDDDRHGRPEAPGKSAEAPGQTIGEIARARREAAAEAAPPASQASQPQAAAAPGSQPGVDPTLAVLPGGAPGQPADLRLHARLHELGAVTRLVVRMAAREEATQARITLEPGDLGQVRISLKYHAGGISAEVVADSAEAAQALLQTVGDLKRSLEAQGLVVHGLDVRLAGGDGQRPDRDPNLPTPGKGRGEAGYELDADDIRIDPGSLPLAGSQVNVLA